MNRMNILSIVYCVPGIGEAATGQSQAHSRSVRTGLSNSNNVWQI